MVFRLNFRNKVQHTKYNLLNEKTNILKAIFKDLYTNNDCILNFQINISY